MSGMYHRLYRPEVKLFFFFVFFFVFFCGGGGGGGAGMPIFLFFYSPTNIKIFRANKVPVNVGGTQYMIQEDN